MSDEGKALEMGRKHTKDSQIQSPGRTIGVLKARELYEMRRFYSEAEDSN